MAGRRLPTTAQAGRCRAVIRLHLQVWLLGETLHIVILLQDYSGNSMLSSEPMKLVREDTLKGGNQAGSGKAQGAQMAESRRRWYWGVVVNPARQMVG